MKKNSLLLLIILLFASNNFAQKSNVVKLLIRCDDIGMSHSVNMAVKEVIKTGIPFSASVMFPCPWYQEAVDILKEAKHVTVGIHLTLNSEWKNYKWGPVLGKSAVPSLVDSEGYFLPTRAAFNENNPKLDEIEMELRAQIERAINSGLDIKYVDYHMGTLVEKPEYRKILVKLANEYHLGISRYLYEIDMQSMYFDPVEEKDDSLYKRLQELNADNVNLLVCHIGTDDPELRAMIDFNASGLKEMSRNRQSELNALTSPKLLEIIKSNNIKLITYKDLIEEIGLENMKEPLGIEY